MPEGTSIEVSDLFYNLPARRKFLKSDAAEAAQVSRVVTQLALCYPEIGFTLTSAGRKVLPSARRSRRCAIVCTSDGERGRPDRSPPRRGDVKVLGYVAALAEQGPTRGPQNVFVNRRIVKDRTIAHAIIDAYSVASIKERSPEVHLFIEMPSDAVDVNVHPTKAEVRFRDQSFMHEVVRRTLGDALGRGPAPELVLQAPDGADRSRRRCRCRPATAARSRAVGRSAHPHRGRSRPGRRRPIAPTGAKDVRTSHRPPKAVAPPRRPWPMIPLGQFRDTFIIAVDEEGIAIIDQHVAHERVLFERSPSG